ncbi:rhodanese-like domain-containing protein [Lacisediminimonas profundi]|uniref:rhodanese-like domain-containing protein n=1 Tax=Lacisediminimonas profundi TaxID=2603856 RepID=UPI00124B8EA1|nr:rhodanese-like domain-containing protein [Lacisediminimonas profundi]
MAIPKYASNRLRSFAVVAALALCSPLAAHAALDKAAVESLESYFDFIDYNSGTIAAQQIPEADWKKIYALDVRDAGQFSKEHIPGAVNIEWRKVFAERNRLPKDKTILVYCNTGSFSGQVAMALRMAGFENVRILHGGFAEWQARGGMDAYRRATAK